MGVNGGRLENEARVGDCVALQSWRKGSWTANGRSANSKPDGLNCNSDSPSKMRRALLCGLAAFNKPFFLFFLSFLFFLVVKKCIRARCTQDGLTTFILIGQSYLSTQRYIHRQSLCFLR